MDSMKKQLEKITGMEFLASMVGRDADAMESSDR